MTRKPMEHSDALLFVPDLVRGRLIGDERQQVETHVSSCSECQEHAATYEETGEAIRRRQAEAAAAHPSSEEIVSFTLTDGTLDSTALVRISSHTAACETCRGEVASVRAANAVAPSRRWVGIPGSFLGMRALLSPAALAAAAVVCALLYPAYLGLVQLPRVRRQLRETPPVPGIAGSPATDRESSHLPSVPGLMPGSRGKIGVEAPEIPLLLRDSEGTPVELSVPEDDPFVRVRVKAKLADQSTSGRGLIHRFELVNSAGECVWLWGVTDATLRRMAESQDGLVTLFIDREAVGSPGPYQIRQMSQERTVDRSWRRIVVNETTAQSQPPVETKAPQ